MPDGAPAWDDRHHAAKPARRRQCADILHPVYVRHLQQPRRDRQHRSPQAAVHAARRPESPEKQRAAAVYPPGQHLPAAESSRAVRDGNELFPLVLQTGR